MSSLGVYFGPKLISIVETKGRKVINDTKVAQSAISTDELEEKVPAQMKEFELVARLKDELRRNKVEAKEATICLCGRDLIIRNLEMPQIPREELKSAINFEAKKYIPFKVEDLVSDFQLKFDKISRTNAVLFLGIKKEVLDKYISIFNQLNIKISSIEYSAFSILRLLKLSGLSDKGIVGILGTDLKLEDETNFTVLENGFPLFSRDIALTSGPDDIVKTEEAGPQMAIEKLKTEMRVSLDYYHHKFPTKVLKKIFFVCEQEYQPNLEALIQEIGLSGKFIDVTKHIGRPISYSLGSVKGYSSSLSRLIRGGLRLNLLAAKEKIAISKARAIPAEPTLLLAGLKLNHNIIAWGLFICAAVFGFGYYRMQGLRKEFNSIISLRPKVTTVNPQAPYADLTDTNSKYKNKLDTLDNLIEKQLYITELLDTILTVVPKGAWLTKFSFNRGKDNRIEISLEGAVYLGDSNREFETVNQFLSGLKGAPNFSKHFKETNIVSMDRKQVDKVTQTNFVISCKTQQDKK